MTIDIDMNSPTNTSSSSQTKGSKPQPLMLASLFTPPKYKPKMNADIFSPRPETPSPPRFPFLDSPTPKQRNQVPSPPTPPRPRRRHALSDTTNALPRHKVCGKTSFELALDAFPAPPPRVHSMPLLRSLPASHVIRAPHAIKRSPLAKKESEEMELDSGSESDGKTITGIPATPSTANSDWDNFWSEPPSPAEDSARSKHEMLLTEAALIREAYLRLKESEFSEKGDRFNGAEAGQGGRYH